MKKKFNETKAFNIIKQLGIGAFNMISPITLKTTLDRNGDGKVNIEDIKEAKPIEIAGAVAMISGLLYFKIINLDQILILIQAFSE